MLDMEARFLLPPGKNTGEGTIQMILPSDYDGLSVYGITDRTIGALLDGLARVQGDNIVSTKKLFCFFFFISQVHSLIHLGFILI